MTSAEDFVAITSVAYRYSQGVDSQDWQAVGDCFTEDAIGDYNEILEGRNAIVQSIRSRVAAWDATQHFTGNPQVLVEGDSAKAAFYVMAQHVVYQDGQPTICLAGAVYHDELVRCDGTWRFSRRYVRSFWTMGDDALLPATIYGRHAEREKVFPKARRPEPGTDSLERPP
jgi:ketosteroid isomerase-like protein